MVPGDDVGPPPSDATLADLIEHLRRATSPDPDKPQSYEALTSAVNQLAGKRGISTAYTFSLAKGKKTTPTVDHLEVLSRYFGVDQGYLLKRDMDEVRAAARVVSADDQDAPRLE